MVLFGGLSTTERAILEYFINTSLNNVNLISADISREICGQLSLTQSSFNTTVFRLHKKGVIKKSGKTIELHPIFNNIQELDKLIISFVSPL